MATDVGKMHGGVLCIFLIHFFISPFIVMSPMCAKGKELKDTNITLS